MSIDRVVLAVAGIFILVSLLLAQLHSAHWLWFTGFVGLNLAQAGFTRFCPMALILKKVGLRPGHAFD